MKIEITKDHCSVAIVLSLIAAFLFLVNFAGYCDGQRTAIKKLQSEAITNGVAYWSVNATNGETSFEWIKK